MLQYVLARAMGAVKVWWSLWTLAYKRFEWTVRWTA